MKRSLVFAALLLAGCPEPTTPRPPPAASIAPVASSDLEAALRDASAGVIDRQLAALLRDHWAWVLREEPLRATRLGVHAYDDRLADGSAEAVAARRAYRRELLGRARALVPTTLSEGDRVTLELFTLELESDIASEPCDFEQWNLSPRDNPVTDYNELPETHRVDTVRDGERLLARYRAIPRAVDAALAQLERGAARGLFANAESTQRVIAMVDKQLAQPLADWPMQAPGLAAHGDWSEEERATFQRAIDAVLRQQVEPAFRRYRDFLRARILPSARPEDRSGLAALPIGPGCYPARVAAFTTLPLSAEEVHALGLSEVARIDGELSARGQTSLGTTDLASTLAKLRSDPALYFTTEDEVEREARTGLDAAKAKMGAFFGRLPKADCVVRRIPDYEAPYTTIAYYRPPHADGSKPGEYFVNVLKPTERPRFEARVLAMHEAIPGHHLQIAISQELGAVPAFRKHGGTTVFVEGWALYTERLADEMGLYRDDFDRIGALSFDAWRASRLVVDTGIHAFGWSRARAKEFMLAHTALTPENIDNEVDRYINWPGQALAYKLGQLEIASLRARAERELGARFSLAAFHDAVLGGGAVSLPVLRKRVEQLVKAP